MPKIFAILFSLTLLALLACGEANDNQTFGGGGGNISGGGESANLSQDGGETPAQAESQSQTESVPIPTETPAEQNSQSGGIGIATGNDGVGRVISDFLWKPESERDGNLVILVDPQGVRIVVTGRISEELTDFGPSNGRGTTARAVHSGCDFGSNVTVEFFSRSGTRMSVSDGRSSVNIPNGCNRLEF